MLAVVQLFVKKSAHLPPPKDEVNWGGKEHRGGDDREQPQGIQDLGSLLASLSCFIPLL